MNANFKKRFCALIVDILVLDVILSIISLFIPTSNNLNNIYNELDNINTSFINEEINLDTYSNRYFSIMYNIDKETFLTNLISVIVTISYFVIYPFYSNGQTFGKKIFKIRTTSINDESVSVNQLLLKNLLMNGLGTTIILMFFIFVFHDFSYFIASSILQFLQFLLVIISIFMVLYRKDKRSLPDLIAGTKVIEV